MQPTLQPARTRQTILAPVLGPLVTLAWLLGLGLVCAPLWALGLAFVQLGNWSLWLGFWVRDQLETMGNKTEKIIR